MKYLIGVLLSILYMWSIPTTASTFGWGINAMNAQKKTLGIINVGDDGGILKLTCDEKTKMLNIAYESEGRLYDFYVIRRFGETATDGKGTAMIGGKILSQAGLYNTILNAEGGFSIVRYPIGTQQRWFDNIESKRINAKYVPEGEEFFITGDIVWLQIEEMVKTCPFNPGDKTPLF